MGYTIFGGQEVAVKDLAGVSAGEMARFANGVEHLECGRAVDRKIVDRFMGNGVVGDVGCLRKHGCYSI